ncbi:MAG: hypothetical protein PHR39_08450 [Actinomycetota bacterium]|nr:hypothetical protein [Actinomycetota bacterium]
MYSDEGEIDLSISLKLKGISKANWYEVVMRKTDDKDMSLRDIVNMAIPVEQIFLFLYISILISTLRSMESRLSGVLQILLLIQVSLQHQYIMQLCRQ